MRLSCAREKKPKKTTPCGEGRGIFCWNNISKLVLSVNTKFHLSRLPGSALKISVVVVVVVGGGGLNVILVFRFGPNSALGLGLRLGPS